MPALILALAAAAPDTVEVLDVLNAARARPSAYADFLREVGRDYAEGAYRENDGSLHATIEGERAVEEAADALDAGKAVTQLTLDPILTAAARDHVEAQGRTASIDHASSAGATPGIRVRQRGGDIYVVEAVSYGMRTAEGVVRQWIVDDGVATRGHRKTVLSPAYRYAGIWCGPHAGRGTMCVIDLAATLGGRPNIPPQR
ncbi:hypothetical protein GCM10011380_25430 [Sphingomonas metalli]|uniref:SCP domain-containing protein n=1 Tax=Sphingomonas metalli TaxID=1779358 RepID=A0A916WV14_9SPHN|nr:CAP domain-containing protein [Sphingomonas metalli]GGB34907.1 hypothetical protein GCM10011380_25430 [Sphingomonas metalli]